VASGAETLFRDHADPDPVSRRVFTFHRPETLERELREPLTLRGRLRAMPPFITDGLRACQIDAVSALEVSMAQNRPRALVQMATGAGKTFTACTLSYRLLAHGGFKRILFLTNIWPTGHPEPAVRSPKSTTFRNWARRASTRTRKSSSPPSSAFTRFLPARNCRRRTKRCRRSRCRASTPSA
jgi:hypothetical protein